MYTYVFLKYVFRNLRMSRSDMGVKNLDVFLWPSKFFQKTASILVN